jgi:hypothetical protein
VQESDEAIFRAGTDTRRDGKDSGLREAGQRFLDVGDTQANVVQTGTASVEESRDR